MNFFKFILKIESLYSPAILTASGETLSRKQLADLSADLFDGLKKLGFIPGERIAVLGTGGSAMLATIISVAENFICVPINSLLADSEIKEIFNDLKISALIIPPGENERPGLTGAPILKIFRQPAGWQIKISGKIAKTSGKTNRCRAAALIIVTSGTTAKPKYVPLSHRNLLANARNMRLALRLAATDRCLTAMPFFHVHGLMAALAALAAGGSVICLKKFEPVEFFNCWSKNKPTWYTASPTMHLAILRATKYNLSVVKKNPIRLIRSSSASLPPKTLKELEKTFRAPVLESYGMTEATLQITSNLLPPLKRKPGSVGRPIGLKLAITDKNGYFLKKGRCGEILIKGASIIKSYEGHRAENAPSFKQGWLKTGDIGYLDKDNYLYLTGRLKEMINKGGENINPKEIERVILGHPAIQQAAAFGIPHKTLGEDIGLALILKKGRKISELAVRRYFFKKISGFKNPSRIFFVKEFPITPTGKIQKFKLLQTAAHIANAELAKSDSPLDDLIINAWRTVLKIKRVSLNDNFFYAGGDSLLAEELLNKLKNRGIGIKKQKFLEEPTLAELLKSGEQK